MTTDPMTTDNLAVFDIDGTLAHTAALADALFARVVGHVLEAPVSERDWASALHMTDSGIVEHLFRRLKGRSPTAQEVEHIELSYTTALQSECRSADPLPGAAGALSAIATTAGWSVAIATGNWLRPAQHKLHISGLDRSVLDDGLLGQSHWVMATASDSHDRAQILELAIIRSGSPRRVVYLGDARGDEDAAAALGVAFIAVGGRLPQARVTLKDYSDLSRVWQALRHSV